MIVSVAMTITAGELSRWLKQNRLGLNASYRDFNWEVQLRRPVGDGQSVAIHKGIDKRFDGALLDACNQYQRELHERAT